jgi:hypothetical protein
MRNTAVGPTEVDWALRVEDGPRHGEGAQGLEAERIHGAHAVVLVDVALNGRTNSSSNVNTKRVDSKVVVATP